MFILYASSALDRGQTKQQRREAVVEDRHKASTKKKATLTNVTMPNSTLPEKFSTTTLAL